MSNRLAFFSASATVSSDVTKMMTIQSHSLKHLVSGIANGRDPWKDRHVVSAESGGSEEQTPNPNPNPDNHFSSRRQLISIDPTNGNMEGTQSQGTDTMASLVGNKIELFSNKTRTYRVAVVISYDEAIGKHMVKFDDIGGKLCRLSLRKRKYRRIDAAIGGTGRHSLHSTFRDMSARFTPTKRESVEDSADDEDVFRSRKRRKDGSVLSADRGSQIGGGETNDVTATEEEEYSCSGSSSQLSDPERTETGSSQSSNSKKKWGDWAPFKIDLSAVQEGDRVAFEFDGRRFFGSVEQRRTKKSDINKWKWHIKFDQGETFEFGRTEMHEAVSLYRDCRRREMEDSVYRMVKIKNMKEKFERTRDDLLSKLPDSVKGQFLQLGFAAWSTYVGCNEEYLPVLFLGPFDVSPGNLREQWMREFIKANGDWRKLPCLVYWIGYKNIDKAFSFITRGRCLSYESGAKLGLNELPPKILKKIQAGKRLSSRESHAVAAWTAMKEVLPKPASEKVPFQKIKEDHELVMDGTRLLAEIEAEAALLFCN